MRPGRGHRLRLEHVTHLFGDVVAVDDVSLDLTGGELVALLGPSGCGKSTLLRIISGFIGQTRGRVLFDDTPVDHLPPNRRGVGIVFQSYALFPHMTVRENVAYGLQAHHWPREKAATRVEEMLKLVHMEAYGDRLPRALSGGQQQRVALARCLAVDPKVLLLDEPFGALDKNLRLDMQIEVKRLHREYGITTVLVTHDQEEALSMADRVAVMNRGRIEQIASPSAIYDQPETLFVTQFVGTTNLLAGRLAEVHGGGCRVEILSGVIHAAPTTLSKGSDVVVSIRPEHLRVEPGPGSFRLAGTIKTVMPLGPQVVYDVELAGGIPVKVTQTRGIESTLLERGSAIYVTAASPAACRVFPTS